MAFREIIRDPQKFDALLGEIDDELRSEGVAIPGRPLAAGIKITGRFRCAFTFDSPESEAIHRWYVNRYGDRLKMQPQIGETVVRIKGDPYRVRLPLVFGVVQVNPLTWIEDVAPGLWPTLTRDEIEEIARQILDLYKAFNAISALPRDCTVDLSTAVHHLMQAKPEPGLSKWASLQAGEKTLKAYIRRRGGNPPTTGKHGHNLERLAELAQGLGLPVVSQGDLLAVQCSPGVRYDVPVSLDKAIDAHHASVGLCRHVALSFPS